MDPDKQIEQLIKDVQALRRELDLMRSTADVDPEVARALGFSIIKSSTANVTDYDRSVNESGASSYTVPKVQDGHFYINGKLVPFYDPI